MPVLGVSVVDVLIFVALGTAGFLVVALVCAAVLAVLQLVLPSTDSGAAEADRLAAAADEEADPGEPSGLDSEADA